MWKNNRECSLKLLALTLTDMSIQEISDYLNFSNQSFFSQYFKRFSGCSPSDYRTRPKLR
ncbi:MAG: helix-turn-helix domain-containing protein [Chloroflexota bacterium]